MEARICFETLERIRNYKQSGTHVTLLKKIGEKMTSAVDRLMCCEAMTNVVTLFRFSPHAT
jgi:hypothetical protein